jgi:hypothetical protein
MQKESICIFVLPGGNSLATQKTNYNDEDK